MKKILSIVGIAVLAIGINAAEFDSKTLFANYKAGNFDSVITTVEAGKTAIKAGSPYVRRAAAFYYVAAKVKKGMLKSSAQALTEFNNLYGEFGGADDTTLESVNIYQLFNDNHKAVEIARKSSRRNTQFRGCVSLARLKRYEEAADWAITISYGPSYRSAVTWACLAKVPVKVLNYSLAAINAGALTDPVEVKKVVNYILNSNFTGTTVTDAQIKSFLQTVNRRCSRFLTPGVPTVWDEVIQLVRQTLEAY